MVTRAFHVRFVELVVTVIMSPGRGDVLGRYFLGLTNGRR